jgi:hypothetical protein
MSYVFGAVSIPVNHPLGYVPQEHAQPAQAPTAPNSAQVGTDSVRQTASEPLPQALRQRSESGAPLSGAHAVPADAALRAELLGQLADDSEPTVEDETLPLPAFSKENRLSDQDCRDFLQTQVDAARHLAPAGDFSTLQAKIDSFQMPTNGHGKVDSAALKHDIKAFTAEVKQELKNLDPALAARLEPARHELLAQKDIWSTGYAKADSVGWNQFTPLAALPHVREASGLQARTCHAHTTEQPINAWKTSYGAAEKQPQATFYRNGTFAPQPSKLGEKWSHDDKQAVANARAQTLVKSLIADFIASHPGQKVDHFTFSNLNLMSRFNGEPKLTAIHHAALQSLNGRSFNVTVNGQAHEVQVDVRAWRQDIKDASYLGTNKEMRAQNRSALQSLDQAISRLSSGGKVPASQLRDMEKLRATIGRQLELQEVKGLTRLFEKVARGIANLAGGERSSPRMDPSEVSALIIALESKIAEHEPGAISEGCKSGKDRGSIVDASAKALLHEMAEHGGRVPDHVLRPGWMLAKAKEDNAFRNDLHDIFLGNYELQKANTGFKGYITKDMKVAVVGGENYIDRLAHLVFDDKKAIKAGSGMIKS